MKRLFALLLLTVFAAAHADAMGYEMTPPKQPNPPTPHADETVSNKAYAGPPKVEVSIAKEANGPAASAFPANVPQLFASFKTRGTKKGDKLRGVWISESAGKNKKLYETTLTGNQSDFVGSFSIKAPPQGWPPGKYKVEVYLGNQLAATARFMTTAKGG